MDIGKDLQKAYDEGYADGKADTVRKMQERFSMHFGTYTGKDKILITEMFRLLYKFAEEVMSDE